MYWKDNNNIFTNSEKFAKENNFYLLSAKELYNFIESQTDKYNCWDAIDNEGYVQLADYCGLDRRDYSDTQEFMDTCLKVIENGQ